MTKQSIIDLPEDYAQALQEIKDKGQEDFSNLAETLQVSQPRLQHIVQSLRRKGLVSVGHTWGEAWISLTMKGKKLTRYIWPKTLRQS